MNPLAINVTGIRTDDGGTTHTLKRPLTDHGYTVANYQTGRRWLGLDARRRGIHARNLAEWIEVNQGRPTLCTGHSDGCVLLLDAFRLLAERNVQPASLYAVFVNPALAVDVEVPACVGGLDVLYDPHDGWTGIAAAWLSGLTRGRHPWGPMGQRGHSKGRRSPRVAAGWVREMAIAHGDADPRITNIEIGDGRNGPRDHSSIFDDPAALADRIVKRHNQFLQETPS